MSASSPSNQPRFHLRRPHVTACARCRTRKQRCDQKLPACSNCERAGLDCISADVDGSVAPRSYVKSLEDHIAFLEQQLMSASRLEASTTPVNDTNADIQPSSSQDKVLPENAVSRIVHDCSQPECFTKNITYNNGQSLLRSLLHGPLANLRQKDLSSGDLSLISELPYEMRIGVPTKNVAHQLANIYVEHCGFFSPIFISKSEIFGIIDSLYDPSLSPNDLKATKFQASLIFGTALVLLNRTNPSVPLSRAEGYFASAIQTLHIEPDLIFTGDFAHLKNLLLIVQYCCFASNLTAAWHFCGLATRLVIELNLHSELKYLPQTDSDTTSAKRWLFWATYTFERNLCIIIGRPFSIPDEAIDTPLPLPSDDENNRVSAIHLIKLRRLDSEIYTTLHQNLPPNGAFLDYTVWRDGMRDRLLEWHQSVPGLHVASQLAPTELFDVYLLNCMVALYYPSCHFPQLSNDDIVILARNASRCIDCYKTSFRDGKLRFYWRTIHNLFRSGVAAVLCAHLASTQPDSVIDVRDMIAAISSCSNTLWAMVERFPAGRAYRDVFENLVSSALKGTESGSPYANDQATEHQAIEPFAIFDLFPKDNTDGDLPTSAIDALWWGFGEPR